MNSTWIKIAIAYTAGMITYSVFQNYEQAGQLRFNFINSNHDRLPFSSQLTFADKEKEILNDYLNKRHSETTKVFKEIITAK